jgi:glycosyltransferase involved in cell wall biosynthesis
MDVVCFSNDWDGDPLSKTHLMRRAAREGRVLWVDSLGNRAPRATGRDLRRMTRKLAAAAGGLREVEPGMHVLSPLALPFFGHPWARALNARLLERQVRHAMHRIGMSRPVVVSFLPAAAPVFPRLPAGLRVYYCVDEFSAFEGAGASIRALENALVDTSDLVVCTTRELQADKRRRHPNVALVPHGVDVDHFAGAASSSLRADARLTRLGRPVLAFMGLVAEWVDQSLLVEVARRFPHATLLVIGRADVDTTALAREPNVVLLGRRPYAELPGLLAGVDVGLCAFRENDLTRAANPLKVREYLAAGLPVVSTPIPEVERLGLPWCRVARGTEAFIAAIGAALADRPGPCSDRAAAMRSESWDERWRTVRALFEQAMERRDGRVLHVG